MCRWMWPKSRDPKGLYKKARRGDLPHLPASTLPTKRRKVPDLRLDTSKLSVEECVDRLLELL